MEFNKQSLLLFGDFHKKSSRYFLRYSQRNFFLGFFQKLFLVFLQKIVLRFIQENLLVVLMGYLLGFLQKLLVGTLPEFLLAGISSNSSWKSFINVCRNSCRYSCRTTNRNLKRKVCRNTQNPKRHSWGYLCDKLPERISGKMTWEKQEIHGGIPARISRGIQRYEFLEEYPWRNYRRIVMRNPSRHSRRNGKSNTFWKNTVRSPWF